MFYRILVLLLFIFIILTLTYPLNNNPPQSSEYPKERTFRKSKILAAQLYKNNRKTFYCGCSYDNKKINLESCGYKIRKNAWRARRLEWEHIVPASYFGQNLKCWIDGGRRNCTSNSDIFSNFEGDLHNLVPEIGELNADRSNLIHGETSGNSPYGSCEFIINQLDNIAQPRKEIRGDIARIWLYMSQKYYMGLSNNMRDTYERWHRDDPPDEFERWKNQMIREIQGDGNPFIEQSK